MALKENYVDDILDTSKNTKRKYNMITNADGTVSFEDVTDYSQNGDNFGASDVNAITKKVNKSLTGDDVVDNLESTATDMALSANMGRELKENIYQSKVKSKYVKAQLTTSVYGYYYFDETTKIYRGETKIPIPDDATEVLGVMAGACYTVTGNVNTHYPFECVYYNGEITCTSYSPTQQTLEFGVTIIYI